MAVVFIPTLLRAAAQGASRAELPGATVRELIVNLDARYPGLGKHLMEGERLRPNISVAIDGEIAPLGLLERVPANAEVHFVTAISGGRAKLKIS